MGTKGVREYCCKSRIYAHAFYQSVYMYKRLSSPQLLWLSRKLRKSNQTKHLFLKLLQVRGAFKNFANSKFEKNFQLQFQTFKLIRHKKVHIAYHDNSYVVTKKTPLTQRISNYIAVLLTRYTVDGISGALEIGLMFGLFSVPCIIARMALTPIAGEVIKF